jgi:hypothetical protein
MLGHVRVGEFLHVLKGICVAFLDPQREGDITLGKRRNRRVTARWSGAGGRLAAVRERRGIAVRAGGGGRREGDEERHGSPSVLHAGDASELDDGVRAV